MNVRQITVGAGAVASAAIVGWAIFASSESARRWLYRLIERYINVSGFWDVAETFCNETAILWFVFPVLDTLYDRANDKAPPSTGALLASLLVVIAFFVAAVYCKRKTHALEAKEEQDKLEKRLA